MKLKKNVYLALGLTALLGLGLTGCGTTTAVDTEPVDVIVVSESVTQHMDTESIFANIESEIITTTIATIDDSDMSVENDASADELPSDTVVENEELNIMNRLTGADIFTEDFDAGLVDLEAYIKEGWVNAFGSVEAAAEYEATILKTGAFVDASGKIYPVVLEGYGADSLTVNIFDYSHSDAEKLAEAGIPLMNSQKYYTSLAIAEGETVEECLERSLRFYADETIDDSVLIYAEDLPDEDGNRDVELYSLSRGEVLTGTLGTTNNIRYYGTKFTNQLGSSDKTHLDLSGFTEVDCYFVFK